MVRSSGRSKLGMGSWGLSLGAAAAVSTISAVSQAQPPSRMRPAAPSGGGITVNRDPAGDAILLGRTRMAKGDCKGALEAFDAALRTSVDVTVHRDRGLCHEQLAQPFPAMEDFRIYLTALPEAPDAEDIRSRLNALEVANGFGGTGTGGTTVGSLEVAKATGNHEDPFAVEVSNDAAKSGGVEITPGSGDRARVGNYDEEIVANERWDAAESSPLRRGTGLAFGAYGRGFGGTSNGETGYGVGATLRGSISRVSSIYGEIGYVAYRAGDVDTGIQSGGFSIGLGYEARIRLDQLASNAIILAAVANYERINDSVTRAVGNVFDPRVKLGYRHVFGPGFGIEIGGEVAQPVDLASGSSSVTFFGGTLAILVGF